ncbi:unnamed protein product [Somion occarium]|uniref:Secreted protein n=1 Tax=Somion occarium TaxID=3059160 RepID=A0ABP1DVV5_9APHY
MPKGGEICAAICSVCCICCSNNLANWCLLKSGRNRDDDEDDYNDDFEQDEARHGQHAEATHLENQRKAKDGGNKANKPKTETHNQPSPRETMRAAAQREV